MEEKIVEKKEFNSRLVLGLLIVIIGLLCLARTMGVLTVDLSVAWAMFWPVAIMVAGLSLISKKGWLANLITLLVFLVIVWILLLVAIGSPRVSSLGMSQETMIKWGNAGYWQRLEQLDRCMRELPTN